MKRAIVTIALLCASCGQSEKPAEHVDVTFDAALASQTLGQSSYDLSALKVHAVCGPSAGEGLFDANDYADFQADGITDGRMIFVSGADGAKPDLIFRDATGKFWSSVEGGTEIKLIAPKSDSSAQMWIASNPSTGIVESHNLFLRNGKLIDLWTSNRPSSVLGAPSAKIYLANCVRL